MPGIITHIKVLHEALKLVKKKRETSAGCRSLEILFSDPDRTKAAHFGSLGPDIFNCLPFSKHRGFFGTDINAFLHSEGIEASIRSLLDQTLPADDQNNEWTAVRRAYLYGYAAHLATDAVFNPFIFYWTGFPEREERRAILHFREQYLLFVYNLDNFFQYFHAGETFEPDIQAMLPLIKLNRSPRVLYPAVKNLLLEMLQDVFRDMKQSPLLRMELNRYRKQLRGYGIMDILPQLFLRVYRLKKNGSPRMKDFQDRLRRRRVFIPDFVTRYPDPKRLNRHVLNLHRERWYYPAGSPGLHYESVEDLFRIARDRVLSLWEMSESALRGDTLNLPPLIKEMSIDAFTGEAGKHRTAMNIKNPYRLRF